MDSDFGNTTTFAARPLECLYETPIPAFLSKTYDLVDDASLDSIISWGEEGCSFVVWDPIEFSRIILPRNFKHNNFSSFVRQLNTYGFRKIDTDKFEFTKEGFVKGKKHLLRNIQRRRSHQQIGSSRESGRTAIQGEVECLRQDRNFVMQELTQLQQQQRGATEHMEAMKQKLETAEKRQKQMVSFLAEMLKKSGTEHKSVTSSTLARKCLKQDEGSSPKGQLQLEPELYGVTLPSLAYHNEDMEEQQKGTVMDSVIRKKDAMSPEIEYEYKSITSSRLAGKCSSKGQLEPELYDITYPSLAYHIEDMEELQQGTMMDSIVGEKDVVSPINQAREECLIMEKDMDFDGSSWADANMVELDPAITWDIDCGFDKWPEEDLKFFN